MFWSKLWICVVTALAVVVAAGGLLLVAPLGERLNDAAAVRLQTAQEAFLAVVERDHQLVAHAAAPLTADARIADALEHATRAAADLPMIRESLFRYLEKQRADLHADVLIAVDNQQRVVGQVGLTSPKDAVLPDVFLAEAIHGVNDTTFVSYGGTVLLLSSIPVRYHDRFSGALLVGTRFDAGAMQSLAKRLGIGVAIVVDGDVLVATIEAPPPPEIAKIAAAHTDGKATAESRWLLIGGALAPTAPKNLRVSYFLTAERIQLSAGGLLSTLWHDRGSFTRAIPLGSFLILLVGGALVVTCAFVLLRIESRQRRPVHDTIHTEALVDEGSAPDTNTNTQASDQVAPPSRGEPPSHGETAHQSAEVTTPRAGVPEIPSSQIVTQAHVVVSPVAPVAPVAPPVVAAPSAVTAQAPTTPIVVRPKQAPVDQVRFDNESTDIALQPQPTLVSPPPAPPKPADTTQRDPSGPVVGPWSPRGAPTHTDDALDADFREVFREYVETRHRQGEPIEGLSYDKFIAKLRANRAELLNMYDCKEVKFEVYVKDGKTKLKAMPVVDG